MSERPSPSKSCATSAWGAPAMPKVDDGAKAPAPSPDRSEMVEDCSFATARSALAHAISAFDPDLAIDWPRILSDNMRIRSDRIDAGLILAFDTKRGLYVTSLMGFGFNPVTGDFSRGAQGFWIENGELTFPVSEITIPANGQPVCRNTFTAPITASRGV